MDDNKAIYAPPEIEEVREMDLENATKKRGRLLKWMGLALLIFVCLGGLVLFITDPNVLRGLSTPQIFQSTHKIPVAVLTDDEGNSVVSSLGCIVSNDQFGVAPLSYFARIREESRFEIVDAAALLEAFGCLMPSLMASGLRTIPVSAILGSGVTANLPSEIHGVFHNDAFPIEEVTETK